MFLVMSALWTVPAAGQTEPTMTVTTSATYRVDVEEHHVAVEFGYVFENATAATAFPGFFESLPDGVVDVVARDRSGDLLAGATESVDGFETWLIAFRSPLEPGETLEVWVDWVIEGGRSLPGPIVEEAAAAFDVYVPGSDGATWSAPVFDVPAGFRLVSPVTPAEPYEIARAEFVDSSAVTQTTMSLPPDLTLSDWQERSAWSDAVRDRAAAVVGSLETWFGPRTEPLEVRRAFPSEDHPVVDPGFVELAEQDAESIDHQLAHAWLADVPVDEPWFIEGLAAAFAGDQPNPSGPADVVPVIVNEIGAAGVLEVVEALRAGTITYPGVVAEDQPLPPDWRTLLDHLDRVAGADGIDELFHSAVIDPADAPLLDRRAAARTDYDALVFRAGGWVLPSYLRTAMAAWEFDTFTAEQGAISDVILRRDALFAWEESLDLEPRDDAKAVFEAAERDMSEVNALLDEQEAALAAFDEAERLVNGDRGLLAAIGLLGHDADGDLAGLRDAWAEGDYQRVEHDGHELAALVEGAVGDGTIRLLVPAVALLALVWVLRVVRRRFFWRRGPAAQP